MFRKIVKMIVWADKVFPVVRRVISAAIYEIRVSEKDIQKAREIRKNINGM
jgi:hypothetical protein